jgi:hypothetical protein
MLIQFAEEHLSMGISDCQENLNDNAFQALPSVSLFCALKYFLPKDLRVSQSSLSTQSLSSTGTNRFYCQNMILSRPFDYFRLTRGWFSLTLPLYVGCSSE